MAQSICLTVYKTHELHLKQKFSLSQHLYVDDSLVIPYSQIVSTMRFLYGNDCIIEFYLSHLTEKKK